MADLNRLQLTLDLEANAAALAMACVHEVPPIILTQHATGALAMPLSIASIFAAMRQSDIVHRSINNKKYCHAQDRFSTFVLSLAGARLPAAYYRPAGGSRPINHPLRALPAARTGPAGRGRPRAPRRYRRTGGAGRQVAAPQRARVSGYRR